MKKNRQRMHHVVAARQQQWQNQRAVRNAWANFNQRLDAASATIEQRRESLDARENALRQRERDVSQAVIVVRLQDGQPCLRGRRYQFLFEMDVDALLCQLRVTAAQGAISAGGVVREAFRKAEAEFMNVAERALREVA